MIALIVCAVMLLAGFFGWLVRQLIEIKTGLASVSTEHRNNGGSSTRDAIDRIERKLDLHLNWHIDRV